MYLEEIASGRVLRPDSDYIRVGVVGFGKMGVLHASILNAMPGVKVIAVCERSRLMRHLLPRMFKDIKVVSRVEALSEFGLDAVYVTTPTPSHLALVKCVLQDHIASNIFVEKPLGATYAEASEATRLIENGGGTGAVGYQKRFACTFRKGRELLNAGAVGKPSSFRSYAYSSDVMSEARGWRFDREAGGGVLRDLGCHLLDLLVWYFGDVKVLSASEKSIYSKEAEDYVLFDLEANGMIGHSEVSWSNANYRLPEVGLTVEGTEGTITITDENVELKSRVDGRRSWFRQDLNDQVPFHLVQSEYTRETEHFISCIRRQEKPYCDFRTAARIDSVIDEIHERAEMSSA